MDVILNSISLLLLLISGLTVYVILMKDVLPKCLVRVRYSFSGALGRGVGKYVSEGGRGVAYEPHPSIRKYVKRYAIFTSNGYKYIKCKLDSEVERLTYTVVMINNRNRVVDVIRVSDTVGGAEHTNSVMLHEDTSYVAFVLNSANGETVNEGGVMYCKPLGLVLYMLAVCVLSFAALALSAIVLSEILATAFMVEYSLLKSLPIYIVPSVMIGAICTALLLLYRNKNGVRVGSYEK